MVSQKLHSPARQITGDELLNPFVDIRQIWLDVDICRTDFALNLSRFQLRSLITVIMGHWSLGVHDRKLGVLCNDFCRSSYDEVKT